MMYSLAVGPTVADAGCYNKTKNVVPAITNTSPPPLRTRPIPHGASCHWRTAAWVKSPTHPHPPTGGSVASGESHPGEKKKLSGQCGNCANIYKTMVDHLIYISYLAHTAARPPQPCLSPPLLPLPLSPLSSLPSHPKRISSSPSPPPLLKDATLHRRPRFWSLDWPPPH